MGGFSSWTQKDESLTQVAKLRGICLCSPPGLEFCSAQNTFLFGLLNSHLKGLEKILTSMSLHLIILFHCSHQLYRSWALRNILSDPCQLHTGSRRYPLYPPVHPRILLLLAPRAQLPGDGTWDARPGVSVVDVIIIKDHLS